MVRRLMVAAIALVALGLVIALCAPADASVFVSGGVGLALMFGGLLLAYKAQRLSGEDPEDRAFARAVERGHMNPGAVAMHVKGKRLIAEGRKENNPEKVRNGERMLRRAYSFLGGGGK